MANARIEFENGLVANLTASRISTKQMRKIRIFQSRSYVRIDLLDKKLDIYSITENDSIDNKSIQLENIDALNHELLHFIDSIIKDRQPLVSAYDGMSALKLALRVEELICR